ncbi:MAG TPA: hypothetical protein VMB21_11170 [Candidatus Limnocylindria bacterium]|nr:hypothetical protein [Candidatus Limnocylindria bacterium]
MKTTYFAIQLLAVSLISPLQAEEKFWDSPEAYLRQAPPADRPKIFAPGLLADAGTFALGRVAFSPDGREFYYSQNDSWYSDKHARMKLIRHVDGKWNPAITLNEGFVSPTLSMDGAVLYLRRANGMKNVWQSRKVGNAWTAPTPLLETAFGVYDYLPTLSGNAYVASEPDPEDVKYGSTYVFSQLSWTNGRASVHSLGRPLNAKGWNGDLFVAPDEAFMIVSARETKDFESELHISFRKPDSTWTAPVSLGPKINDGPAHRWGQYVTPDKKFLFYCHGTSEQDCAIWWVRFDRLVESLRPKS